MHKKFSKVQIHGFRVMQARQTGRQNTDILITILCTSPRSKVHACTHALTRMQMHTHAHNHFAALLDFFQDYPGELVPER